MHAAREDGQALGAAREVRNRAGEGESDVEPVLAAIEEACYGREEAPTPAVEGLKCRALTNPQRKALLVALKPSGWKGLYKLRTAEQLASELAAYVGGGVESVSIREFVEKARGILREKREGRA